MVSTRLYTADDLITMGPDAPYELIKGELHEVSPCHFGPSELAVEIAGLLREFVRPRKLGRLSGSDGGYLLARDPDTMLAPDVGFVRRERMPAGYDGRSFFPGRPDLAVEVVSESNTRPDILRKVALYQEAGVPLVWVVFPRQRAVEIHPLDEPVTTRHEGDELDGGDVLPGFRLPVAAIFADPLAD